MNAIVWKTYPTPFNDEVIYDDFDFIQGDDEIHGNDGNDILHGQRGFDKLYGEDGEDELYGELEDDELHGGPGNGILIGDIGYAVRRYNESSFPVLNSKSDGAAGRAVWHKDIVLE
uniref:Uncharacterized protein n=1 Tax=Ditylum brightwellii TaxID=49249 RepID=A0A7S4R4N7_9STRA|mmetsp:Transcript_26457/g.35259  ORF Transcript_26457/g.35259 Transcript_26457/m.35259 type:complete len:116 (+) Transcript_26457:657-1004(+)